MDNLTYKTRKDLPEHIDEAIQKQIDSLITLEATQFEDCFLGWELTEDSLIIGEFEDGTVNDNRIDLTFEVMEHEGDIIFKGVTDDYYLIDDLSSYITDVYDCIFW